jgi:hypothetical protein
MAHSKGTRRQHFIPQLLLSNFARENGRLFAYDMAADRSFSTTVRDAGQQGHFLSDHVRDGDGGSGSYFERFFQDFEGAAATAIRSVRSHLQLGVLPVIGPNERGPLARFVALQYLRTPAARCEAVQVAEMLKRSIAMEIASKNAFDVENPSVQCVIERFATLAPGDEREIQAESLLDPDFIEETAKKLSAHVWLVGINGASQPLYIADNPVALHAHVDRPTQGLGITSYGVEVVLPISSALQLSAFEREFVRGELPSEVESLDGCLYTSLNPDNVLYERWLQVTSARQFIYCELDDFADARKICEANPELRNPDRPLVEGDAFGRHIVPPLCERHRVGRA